MNVEKRQFSGEHEAGSDQRVRDLCERIRVMSPQKLEEFLKGNGATRNDLQKIFETLPGLNANLPSDDGEDEENVSVCETPLADFLDLRSSNALGEIGIMNFGDLRDADPGDVQLVRRNSVLRTSLLDDCRALLARRGITSGRIFDEPQEGRESHFSALTSEELAGKARRNWEHLQDVRRTNEVFERRAKEAEQRRREQRRIALEVKRFVTILADTSGLKGSSRSALVRILNKKKDIILADSPNASLEEMQSLLRQEAEIGEKEICWNGRKEAKGKEREGARRENKGLS